MSRYPEHDKQHAVAFAPEPPAHTLTAFYDWLHEQGIVLSTWGEPYDVEAECPDCPTLPGFREADMRHRHRQVIARLARFSYARARAADYARSQGITPCPTCQGTGRVYHQQVNHDRLSPIHARPQELFARFFEINLDVIEQEKRAMIDDLRAANA